MDELVAEGTNLLCGMIMEYQGIDKKGREIYFGTGSPEKVHQKYNRADTFEEVLDSVKFIMCQYYIGIMHKDIKTMYLNRKIYGKRKII